MINNTKVTFQNLEQVKHYAEKENKVILFHNDKILDVTTFSSHHPGGALLLRNNNLKDVQEQMKFHQPLTLIMADTMTIGSFKTQIQRIIDPEKCLSPQIWNADEKTYMKLINSPHWLFVESPRIFDADWLQAFCHNKWYSVIFLPTLFISYYLYNVTSWHSLNWIALFLTALSGILTFSLIQYCLHRFVFHSENILPDSRLVRYLHYFTHGIHHMLPNDPDRLVLPAPLFLFFFAVVKFLLSQLIVIHTPAFYAIFWSFFLVGYMIYDISHYALHHIDTTKSKGSWFHKLQQYHNMHHFSGQDAGYGVSSPLWDIVFRTGYKYSKKQ